jgi:hypothetical protein
MKKAKVTKRPTAREDLTLRPSRLRMFLIYIVLFALAIAAGQLIRLVLYPSEGTTGWLVERWPVTLGIIVGGAALMALLERNRWTLRLVNREQLEGPTGAFGERIRIPLSEINWERTRRSLNSRVKIGNGIYGLERRRILVSQWFFEPEGLHEMLRALGYEKQTL